MKILVSAFACSPLWGSEPSVGWNWAWELARDHEVTVLTHAHFRSHIETHMQALPAGTAQGGQLHFDYLSCPPARGDFHEQLLNSQAYYLRWQRAARQRVLQLLAARGHALVHHVTWGNFRWPVPLHGLPVPLVVGPLGGGERAPHALYRDMPWKLRFKEVLRDLIIASGRHDPFVARGLAGARWVFCRTPQTLQALPWAARSRACIVHDIGAPPPASGGLSPAGGPNPAGPLRCLFVGRLLAWKGAHFALRAVHLLRARGVPVQLTLVGRGEAEAALRDLAARLQLGDTVQWLQDLPREAVLRLYAEHDLFLFPSLHDSGGTVVLESLSRGCPVVCLDLGGPPHFVDETCGRVVPAADGDATAVPGRLADALQALAADPALRWRLREGALAQAQRHSWPARVRQAYAPVLQALAAERGLAA
jgi:glycosyltransferase involved in cell wall biosynthesis